ncbi:hypothetical protein OOU_Y34scaffold00741g2 [Pyricularia oryzae Y34]|uniref:Uncharacterized protein n=2 Tax=Pyricularia oryzae TaxID=318829 RepID=A0AA97NRF0_PYRO3|nr:hypothetical protein OOU_Y34scaffold00741g2 [Pyricularia oryzae Y34]
MKAKTPTVGQGGAEFTQRVGKGVTGMYG